MRGGARARGVRDKTSGGCEVGAGNAAYLVDSAVAVGVPRPSGEHPRRSWVLSMSNGGRVAARCAFTRARGRVPDEGGRRERRPGAPMGGAKPPSVTGGPRGVRDCARRARAGYRTSAQGARDDDSCSVSRETSSAACEVRTAITRNSTVRRALDVTTFFDELLKACFWSSRAPRRPMCTFLPAERAQKLKTSMLSVTRPRKDRNERALTGARFVDRRG